MQVDDFNTNARGLTGLYDSLVETGGRNIDDNPDARFENAIALNVFNDDNVEYFMYMHSDSKFDWFKHRLTRDYISVQREIG